MTELKTKKQLFLTTDGACIGNPGPGGWACILRYKGYGRELSGSEPSTTNNRMELKAVIEGLRAVKESCSITVRTDSQYLRDGMTKWIHRWKANAWQRQVKGEGQQPVKNRDLWEELDRLAQNHEITWLWVKGHSSDEDNNRCDDLANQAARRAPRKNR
jgi:ribonuclease HI